MSANGQTPRPLDFDKVILPLHLPSHWCLGVIDVKRQEIQYFDSKRGPAGPFFAAVRGWLEMNTPSADLSGNESGQKGVLRTTHEMKLIDHQESCKQMKARAKTTEKLVGKSAASTMFLTKSVIFPLCSLFKFFTVVWRNSMMEDCPSQSNDCDCGVFVVSFADCLSRNEPFWFGEGDMPRIRREICLNLLCGQTSQTADAWGVTQWVQPF